MKCMVEIQKNCHYNSDIAFIRLGAIISCQQYFDLCVCMPFNNIIMGTADLANYHLLKRERVILCLVSVFRFSVLKRNLIPC